MQVNLVVMMLPVNVLAMEGRSTLFYTCWCLLCYQPLGLQPSYLHSGLLAFSNSLVPDHFSSLCTTGLSQPKP